MFKTKRTVGFNYFVRDRPFNLKVGGLWFFVSFRIFFSDNTRVRIFFFCRAKREFFFQNSTSGYMTNTLNQIIFFPPPKSEYFFQQHWESEYFFRKKTYPPPFKLNGRSLNKRCFKRVPVKGEINRNETEFTETR